MVVSSLSVTDNDACTAVDEFTEVNLQPQQQPNLTLPCNSSSKVKLKFSHIRYPALGPELISVYRQSACTPGSAYREHRDYLFTYLLNSRRKSDIAVRNRNHLTATGNHRSYGISQCYLPPGRGDFPAFTPAEAGTRFSDPEGCKAEST